MRLGVVDADLLGDPLLELCEHLFDVDLLQTRFARLRQAFVTRFPSLRIAYSYKTNAVAGITNSGSGADGE